MTAVSDTRHTHGSGRGRAGSATAPDHVRRYRAVDACASPSSSLVVVGTIATLWKGTYDARHWFDFFMFGLTIGGVYALIALGYTMVYGVLRLINFAHGDITMTGAFSAYLPGAQLRPRRLPRRLSDPATLGDHGAVDGGVHGDGADRRARSATGRSVMSQRSRR